MRRPIDTAPRDGKFVILEDDVSGSFEFAQWSAEARGWVREDGEPSEITPTHWQTMHLPQEGDEFILEDEFIPQKETGLSDPSPSREPRSFRFPSGQATRAGATDVLRQAANADPVTVVRLGAQAAQGKSEHEPRARRWFAVYSVAAAMVGASLIGLYFHAELAAYVTRYSGQLNNVRTGSGGVVVAEQKTPVPIPPRDTAQVKQSAEAQQPLEKERRRADAPANEQTAQLSPAAETATSELRQSLQKEHDRADALAGELAKARRDIETQLALPSKARDQAAQRNQPAEKATAELRQSLKTEHDRAEALTGELAKARRDLETQVALSSKTGDEAVRVKKAAESATAELRQSLQKESDRAEALTSELAKAKREIETQLARSSQASDEAAQVKKAAENATAELRQSLEKEHERSEALSSDLAKAQRDTKTQAALSSKTGDEAVQVKKAAESATAELRQSLQKEHDRAEALNGELAKAKREIESQMALSKKPDDEAAQVKKAAESARADLQQSLQKEHDRAEALNGELAKARREIETQVALSKKPGDDAAQVKKAAENATTELRLSLQKEHERAEALTGELARARREVEAQAALSGKKDNEAAQLKRAAETAATGLQQSVQQERERAEALVGELAKAQREVKAQAALLSKKDDEAAQLKRAAETTTAELQQSLRQQRDKTQAIESELAMARRDVETVVATPRKTDDDAAQLKQATKDAQAELLQSSQQERDKFSGGPAAGPKSTAGPVGVRLPLAANSQTIKVRQAAGSAEAEQQLPGAEAKGSAEAARLLERADALLGQGNIGAARAVLERAAETGSAQASFELAETYDPLVLSTWRIYGTQGDATRARELYAKAFDGGVKAAKDRSDALQAAGSEAK